MAVSIPEGPAQRRGLSSGVQNVVRMRDGNPSDTLMQQANQRTSDAIQRINEDEVSSAKARFLRAKIEQDNKYTDDEDFGTIHQRYSDSIDAALRESAGSISDPRARQMFMDEFSVRADDGKAKAFELARGKYNDHERGNLATLGEEFSRAAETADANDVADMFQAYRERLRVAAGKDIISFEDADTTFLNFREKAATARLKGLEPQDRIDALNGGQVWVSHLPVNVVKALRDEANAELDDQKALSKALELKDLKKPDAFAALRKIKDPDLYEKTRIRLLQMQQDDAASEVAIQDNLYTQILPRIRSGEVTMDAIDAMLKDPEKNPFKDKALSPEQYSNLRAEANLFIKKQAGLYVPEYSQAGVVAAIERFITEDQRGDMVEAQRYFSENSNLLNVADRRYYNNKFIAMRQAKTGGSAKVEEFKSVETARQVMDRVFKANEINDAGVQSQVWDRLQDWSEVFYRVNKRNPEDNEVRARIMDLTTQVRLDPNALFDHEEAYVAELPEGLSDLYWQVADGLRSKDRYISRVEIIKRFEKIIADRRNPVDTEVQP